MWISHRMTHDPRGWIALLLVLAVVLAPAATATGAAPEVLQINFGAVSAAYTPVFVAQDEGIFAKHGLRTDLKYVAAATEVQALLGGSLHIINGGPEFIDARLGGADVIYIGALVGRFVFSLYTRPEIQRLSDLKGKVIGATAPNALTDFAARILIREAGLVPGQDVRILYVKGIPEVFTTLSQGVIDAGTLSPPTTLRARRAGLRELVNLTERNVQIIQASIGTTGAFVKEHPDIVRRYLRALVEAIHLIRTSPGVAKKAIAKYTKTTNAEDLDESYHAFLPAWGKVPYVTAASVQTLLDFSQHPGAKTAKPTDFFDSSFLAEIEKSSFVERLYR